jgi:hypothetical protein
VLALDRRGRFREQLTGRYLWSFDTVPTGARVYLFRVQEQADVVPGGERRNVPVPAHGDPPVPPGTWALRVVRGAGVVERGDLILEVLGEPVRDTIFRESGGTFARADGIRDLYDAETRAPDGVGTYLTPRDVAERGGVAARVYRDGVVSAMTLPRGLVLRTTAAPAFCSAANLAGTTPVRIEDLERGPWLAVVRAEGCEDLHIQVFVFRDFAGGDCTLPATGSGPPGFVWVYPGFWIMEREIVAAEYVDFLNDPATRARIDAARGRAMVPRSAEETYWTPDGHGRYAVPPEWRPDWPLVGVSWDDAKAYAAWRSARDREWSYALPTREQWFDAAHGHSPSDYPFGNRFRAKWVKSCFARPKANLEPVMRFPIDASMCGVYDMAGSASEWLDGWYDEARDLRLLAGGAWGQAQPERFKLYGTGFKADYAAGEFGFRLVARKKP